MVWEWSQADDDNKPPLHPILVMGDWLYNSVESRNQGRHVFRLPYPGGTWLEEKRNNEYLLFLMDKARQVAALGQKNKEGKKLSDQENKLLEEVAHAL